MAGEGRRAHRVLGGRYGIVAISEDPDDRSRLKPPDMVVLIHPHSVQLVRFLERRKWRTAAMGFYRTDSRVTRLSPSKLAMALDTSIRQLSDGWFRADARQRTVLRELFGLPKLPSRR